MSLKRFRRRWQGIIKMELKETGVDGVYCRLWMHGVMFCTRYWLRCNSNVFLHLSRLGEYFY